MCVCVCVCVYIYICMYIQGGMEEAPENGKESPHSVHANGLMDYVCIYIMLHYYAVIVCSAQL